MGNWERQYIIVESGERDVNAVAGHLRASFASLDRRGLDRPERDVWVENGRVHWDSGKRLTGPWNLLAEVHTSFDVPCEWLVGVYEGEDIDGSASLYTWADGSLVLVETAPTEAIITGGWAGLRFLEKQWGIDPACELTDSSPPVPNPVSVAWDSDGLTDGPPPLARFAAEVVGESVETREAARRTLADTSAAVLESAVDALADRIEQGESGDRLDALEQLYAAAESSVVPVAATPQPVLELVDGMGREAMLAAAIVRALAGYNSVQELVRIGDITDDDPAVRRQAARYFGLDGVPRSAGMPVIAALSDEDPHVRAGIAWGLFKLSWSRLHSSPLLESDVSDATLFEHLSRAVEDTDPRVRAGAVLAIALLTFPSDVGDRDVALSAVADGLDGPPLVRNAVEWLLGTYLWTIDETPSSLAVVTAAAITELGGQIDRLSGLSDLFDAEILDAALDHLDEEGWVFADADTETLTAIAMEPDESGEAAGRIGDVLLDRLAEDPVEVTTALMSIADGESVRLDDAVSELAMLTDKTPAATAALATVASEYPKPVCDQWDTVWPRLAFVGEQARPAAEIVAAVAAEDPSAVGTDSQLVSTASSVLYDSLSDPDDQRRWELVESLVSLAAVDPSVLPPGIEPFVDRNGEPTDGGDGAIDDAVDERDPLAVVAAHDPVAAADSLSTLLTSLDASDDARQFRRGVEIAAAVPSVAAELVDTLIEALPRLDEQEPLIDDVTAAIAAGAEHDPSVVEPYVGILLTWLVHSRPAVRDHIARTLAALEQDTPGTLPPSLSALAVSDRSTEWPIDVLATSAPHLVDRMVRETVAAEQPPIDGTATFLTTVAEYRPKTAETGVTRLIERADSVGHNSRVWSILASIAESTPGLVAVGLDELVEHTVESVDARLGGGRKPARTLAVLAEQYPRQVWNRLEEHEPDGNPTMLLERAHRSRVEEQIEAVLEAAGPTAPSQHE